MIVNKENPLNKIFVPEKMVPVQIDFVQPVQIQKTYMVWTAAKAVERMVAEAGLDGIVIKGISAYRSYEDQENVFLRSAIKNGFDHALRYVAFPGRSEHQTGLAIDVGCEENGFELLESFADTDCYRWLFVNAHLYGMIIRYPEGKEAITGYEFEPWHLRYVGVKLATQLHTTQKCLEEIYEK